MVLTLFSRRWILLLWSLSCFASNRTPSNCITTNEEKGSIFVTDDNLFQRSYRLEDFFWTGSGDGPVLEDSFSNETDTESKLTNYYSSDTWKTTTVFHTTTVLYATVYPNAENCSVFDCQPKISPVWTGSVEFSSPVHSSLSSFDIEPAPSRSDPELFRNMTITSEITKVLTITELVTASKDFHIVPTSTQQINVRNFTRVFDLFEPKPNTEEEGAAFPRLDIDFNSTVSSFDSEVPYDQRYWLLTILKRNSYSPELKINTIEEKLSVLYRKAFIRQQEKHLGISNGSLIASRLRRDRRIQESVRVHIHNVTESISNDPDGIGLLYSVTVAGKPVLALTAANDMRLISVNEVVAELGYPVLTKAEPYMKGVDSLGSKVKGRTRDTWLLIGSVIAAVCLLIVLAAIFTFSLSHKKAQNNSAVTSTSNKKHIFEAEEGHSNLAFQEDPNMKVKSASSRLHITSSKFDNTRNLENSAGTTVTFADQRRGSSSSSTCSGSSEATLVRLRHQQKRKDQRSEIYDEKPRPRPRTRMRRIENSECTKNDYQLNRNRISSAISKDRESYDGMTTEGLDDMEFSPRTTRTPTSYLSMPSVKAFPRGPKIPEPLNRVLEPISIRYLDGDSDHFQRHMSRRKTPEDNEIDNLGESLKKSGKEKGMTRHASLEGDPGVIGPIVWKRHCKKSGKIDKDALEISELDGNANIGKMRKRFNDLIDDAFSVFGSRNDSSEDKDKCEMENVPVRSNDGRIHSAVIRPAETFYNFSSNGRPKTTDSKRTLTFIYQRPRGAWDSPSCDTPSKPSLTQALTIDKNSILVDSTLPHGDPAVPLIQAIKDELKKFDHVPAKSPSGT